MTDRSDICAPTDHGDGKKWNRRSQARPAELTAAALRLFSERGFAGTRLEEVAAAAGVSKGTVYLYFESKERLFEAVIREAATPKIEQADAFIRAYEGPTQDLMRALMNVFEGLLDSSFPPVIKLIVAESGNFPELARLWGDVAARPLFALVDRVIRRGIARGEFRSVDVDEVVPLILAPVLALAVWKQSLGQHIDIPIDAHAVFSAHVENFLRGLSSKQTVHRTGRAKR
jgi:AcrR family transcriptional regulator